jgi:hypothetical protein
MMNLYKYRNDINKLQYGDRYELFKFAFVNDEQFLDNDMCTQRCQKITTQ